MPGAGLAISGRTAWRNGSSIRLNAESKKELIRKLLFYWAQPALRRNGVARIARPAAFTDNEEEYGYDWRSNGGRDLRVNRQASFLAALGNVEQKANQVIG